MVTPHSDLAHFLFKGCCLVGKSHLNQVAYGVSAEARIEFVAGGSCQTSVEAQTDRQSCPLARLDKSLPAFLRNALTLHSGHSSFGDRWTEDVVCPLEVEPTNEFPSSPWNFPVP
jgi:hypothetical protein